MAETGFLHIGIQAPAPVSGPADISGIAVIHPSGDDILR